MSVVSSCRERGPGLDLDPSGVYWQQARASWFLEIGDETLAETARYWSPASGGSPTGGLCMPLCLRYDGSSLYIQDMLFRNLRGTSPLGRFWLTSVRTVCTVETITAKDKTTTNNNEQQRKQRYHQHAFPPALFPSRRTTHPSRSTSSKRWTERKPSWRCTSGMIG